MITTTITNNFRTFEFKLAGYPELNQDDIKIGETYYVVIMTHGNSKETVREECYISYDVIHACDFAILHFTGYFVQIEKRKKIAPNASIIEAIRIYFIK